MTYTIYGAPGTGSGIIEAACAELGLDYDARDIDARNGEHMGEAYRRLNPHRKMPTVVTDHGEVLTETVAIIITLDERHSTGGLLPARGSAERAQALRWMTFMATELYPLVEMIDYPERFAGTPEAASVLRKRAEALTRERWLVVEAAASGASHFLSSGFSAVDLYITKVGVWTERAWRQAHVPAIERIITAVRARPALERVWARHIPR